MSSISDIKSQLVIIFDALDEVDQALRYMPRFIDQNVTVGMYYEGAGFDTAEVQSHWAHYKFTITTFLYMYDEVDTMQNVQETLGETLLSALRAKPSLNSTCLFHTIDELKNDYVKLGNGNVYATIEITLTADKEEDD